MRIPLMLKNFVMGDSLDVPFIKFIKVQSVSHAIGFDAGNKVTRVEDVDGKNTAVTYSNAKEAGGYDAGDNYSKWRITPREGVVGERHSRWQTQSVASISDARQKRSTASGHGLGGLRFFSGFKNNDYLNISLPDHNEFTFTKLVDNATPQLAYGCSAQEPYYFAAFFFRRRIGAGIEGVRLPFMGIGLTKCLITSWGLSDETETITLKYKQIMWGTFDQIADINAPTGMSYRTWDTDKKEGGETAEGLALQMLIALLTAGGALAATAIVGGLSEEVTNG
jgi:type VI protein secretion system component Hcp